VRSQKRHTRGGGETKGNCSNGGPCGGGKKFEEKIESSGKKLSHRGGLGKKGHEKREGTQSARGGMGLTMRERERVFIYRLGKSNKGKRGWRLGGNRGG